MCFKNEDIVKEYKMTVEKQFLLDFEAYIPN